MDVEGKGEWARGGGKGKSGEGRKGGREGGRDGWDWREGKGAIGVQPDIWYQRNFSQKLANGTIRPSKNEGLEDCIWRFGKVEGVGNQLFEHRGLVPT